MTNTPVHTPRDDWEVYVAGSEYANTYKPMSDEELNMVFRGLEDKLAGL